MTTPTLNRRSQDIQFSIPRNYAWWALIIVVLLLGAWNGQRYRTPEEQSQAKCWAKPHRHFHIHVNRNGSRDYVCWNERTKRVVYRTPAR